MRNSFGRYGLSIGCLCSVLFGLAVLLTAPAAAWSQEVTASINGTVTDPSGAAVSRATVIATDLDRGVKFTTMTNADGGYSFPRLPVSRYSIRVEGTGFQAAEKPEVLLVLNQIAKVDVQLQVGPVNQTVEVTSAAPILQTESTQVGNAHRLTCHREHASVHPELRPVDAVGARRRDD